MSEAGQVEAEQDEEADAGGHAGEAVAVAIAEVELAVVAEPGAAAVPQAAPEAPDDHAGPQVGADAAEVQPDHEQPASPQAAPVQPDEAAAMPASVAANTVASAKAAPAAKTTDAKSADAKSADAKSADGKSAAPAVPAVPGADTDAEGDADIKPDGDAPSRTAKPAAEEAKPPVQERAVRPFEAFAAVKAGVEAVQNLGNGFGNQAHVYHGPALPTATAPAMAAAAPATAAAPAPTMPVPMTGIAVEIATQALAGRTRFEIRLDPPELGRIDVRLDIDKDGNVKTRLMVERAETLDMLRRDAPQLERALQQAGLKTSDGALQFSLRDQGSGHDGEPSSRQAADAAAADETSIAEIAQSRSILRAGGIDIRI